MLLLLRKSRVKSFERQYPIGTVAIVKEFDRKSRPVKNPVSNQEVLEAIRKYQKGESIQSIAAQFKTRQETVSKWLSDNGIDKRENRTKPSVIEQVIEQHKQGKKIYEIASQLGITRSAITRWLKQTGTQTNNFKTPDLWKEAERLYVQNQLSTHAVAKRLGIDPSTLSKKLQAKGLLRSKSEAIALIAQGKNYYTGKCGWWQSTLTGEWHPAASSYELVRMSQLDKDKTVAYWTRRVESVPYDGKKYIPDLYIKYKDGRKVVEEIKPLFKINTIINQRKFEVAHKYFASKGFSYRVVTENEIGIDEIKNFKYEGLLKIKDEDKKKRQQELAKQYRAVHLIRIKADAKARYLLRAKKRE